MLLSAVSVLVVAQSSSEIAEGLLNNPVYHDARSHECQMFSNFAAGYSYVCHVVHIRHSMCYS